MEPKLIVNLTPTGQAVNEFELDEWIEGLFYVLRTEAGQTEFNVCTSGAVFHAMEALARGLIKPDQIEFRYLGERVPCDQYGMKGEAPAGFVDKSFIVGTLFLENMMRDYENGSI